jgi:hypothetical protein
MSVRQAGRRQFDAVHCCEGLRMRPPDGGAAHAGGRRTQTGSHVGARNFRNHHVSAVTRSVYQGLQAPASAVIGPRGTVMV